MRVLTEDGLLFAASCSSHLSADGLRDAIRGAVAAGSGEYFRYPMTVRFLS